MLKINKSVILLPLIFFFLPSFIFWVPCLNAGYLYFYLFLYIALLILFITDNKNMIIKLYNVYKSTPIKILILGIFLAILNSVFLSIVGITTFGQTIRTIILRIILCYGAFFVYYIYIIGKYITYEKFIKLFIFLYWTILVLGFVLYLAQLLNISFINSIFDVFTNARVLRDQFIYNNTLLVHGTQTRGLPRLSNLYEEPSFYARFLFIFLPFVNSMASVKSKIFANTLFDRLVKITLVPFTWISLLLIQSPIYFIFFIVITFLYYNKLIIKILKKYGIYIIISFLLLIICLLLINVEDTFLNRIIKVLCSLKSFELFIQADLSLGTRIINFIHTLHIFGNYPYTGVGMGNVEKYQLIQILHSNLPITPEMISRVNVALQTNGNLQFNTSLAYQVLASHGIFISLIFLYFHVKLFLELKKISKIYFNELFNANLKGLKWCWLCITILFFYQIPALTTPELLLIYSLMICSIYHVNFFLERSIYNEKNNIYI